MGGQLLLSLHSTPGITPGTHSLLDEQTEGIRKRDEFCSRSAHLTQRIRVLAIMPTAHVCTIMMVTMTINLTFKY